MIHSPAQRIEGLVAFMDLQKNYGIIPLTITAVMDWIHLKVCTRMIWNHMNNRSQTDIKVFDMIRRLEPIEDAIGFNPKSTDEDTMTALHWAAKYGHDACIRTLLSIDPTMTKMLDNYDTSALHVAANYGHDACIRTLLSIDPTMTKNIRNDGLSALHMAANCG
eukprot:PhF_6_TR33869/c3_g1_i1/m.49699